MAIMRQTEAYRPAPPSLAAGKALI